MISRQTNSANRNRSRYSQGGTTDRFNNRLGWWERIIIPQSSDDILYTVLSSENQRADLIAFKFYDKPNLAWLVLQYNNIVDPAIELVTGTIIKLPTPVRVALTITSVSI